MTLRETIGKVVKGINRYKPYIDAIVDPALVIGAANAGMLYGLFKIGESDLSDSAKVLAIGAATLVDYFANKKLVFPLAKKIREIDLRKAKEGLEARIGSWLKTGVLIAAITSTSPYVAKNAKHVIYEAIGPKAEELVYHNVDVSNVKLAEIESTIGRIQRTERWKYLTDKYEKMYGIPQFTIYAMIMEESYGDPTCINERDGGAGLIHTQPSTAASLGLKTYNNRNSLRSRQHAKELKELMKRFKYNLDSLANYDDRFNNEKLISVMAKEIYNNYKKFGKWDAAIAAINTGRGGVYNEKKGFTENAEKYLKRIKKWKTAREDKDIVESVKKDFNERNGKEGLTYDAYIGWFKNNGKK